MKKREKWYKSFSTWLVIFACIILVPILLANIFIIFQSKTNKEVVPSIFGYKPFIVLSGSMEGQIHKGDLIITKIVDPTSLKIDDIIAFRDAENTVTTHRIRDIISSNGTTKFITKGDANTIQDKNLVALEDVEGIYVARISGFGSLMKSLADPTTILIIALVITILFVLGFTISTKKEKDLEREEYLKFKMMKEYQEKEKERLENEELLNLRRMKEQQAREQEQPKEQQQISREEFLELLRLREEKKKREDSDFEDRFRF